MAADSPVERLARVKRVFQDALEVPRTRRAVFLQRVCDGDDELRREVLELFLLHGERDTLLDEPLDPAEAFADLATPREGFVGPYRLLRELGRGGMGVVHLAERDGKQVALKLLATSALSAEVRERFRLEGEILRRLDHPGIAHVLDVGEAAMPSGLRQPWIAMDFVEGQPLLEYATAVQLTVEGRLRLMLAVCVAVQHAHSHGVVHRDLKPGNILVRATGEPVVLDFGVARLLSGDERPSEFGTRTGQLLGTPQYMSPEQVQAEPAGVGPASDVYSLGVILYELLSGRVPYDATSVSLHRAIVTILLTEPPPLGSVVPALRGPTERVVMMALEKAPRHRYRDARELGDDLRCRLEGRTVRARGPGLARRIVSWSRRQQRLAATLAIAVMAGAIALAWVFGGGGRVPRERVLASYREAEELMVSAVPLLYERERTPDTMREVIDRLTRARTLVDAVPPLSHHDFLIRHLEKDLGTAQMLLGELTWDVGAARQACVSFGRARSLAVRDDPAQFRDKQLPELVPEAVPEGDLLGLLAGANLLCYRLWGELATIESARDFARQAYEERLRDLERAPGRLGPGGQGLVDRVAHAWNARAEIAMETAWFYRDAAVARQAVAWSDSARSRWASFGDNWPALGSVLFESARARRAEGALTRDIRPLEAAEQSLRACADYRGPGRPRVFAETREERAALARDRAALEPDPTRAARLLLGALHDLDTARVALRSANATPEQRAALRSAEAEVLAALARVTRAPAWLDSARARLTETSGAFPHTGFPRQASLHWMRLGLLEVARADVNSDHTAIAAARGAFEHARSLARNRRDQAIIARVDEAEKSLDRLPAGSAGGR